MIATFDERLPLLAIARGEIKMFTLPETKQLKPLKMDGWKMASPSYFGGRVYLHHIHVPSFCFGLVTSLIIRDKNNKIPRNHPLAIRCFSYFFLRHPRLPTVTAGWAGWNHWNLPLKVLGQNSLLPVPWCYELNLVRIMPSFNQKKLTWLAGTLENLNFKMDFSREN